MDNIPTWIALLISLGIGIGVSILVQLFIVPWQRRKVLGQTKGGRPVKFTIEGSSGKHLHLKVTFHAYNNNTLMLSIFL